MKRTIITALVAGAALGIIGVSCQKSSDDAPAAASRYLYIASGQCYSGTGLTTYSSSTSSRLVSRYDLNSGVHSSFLDLSAPYQGGSLAPETAPQSILDDGSGNILMLTENAVNMGDRKIFTVPKSSSYNMSVYSNDALALTATAAHVTRSLVKEVDGTMLFSKSIAIEKIGTNTLRIPMGANPWVNNPGGVCGTAATLMTAVTVLPPFAPATTGKILYAHAAATAAQNRLAAISQDGYSVAGNCLGGVQVTTPVHAYASNITGPAIAFPAVQGVNVTAMVYISTGSGTGKLITAYSAAVATELNNNTNQNYAIVAWDVTETASTVTFATPVIMYRDFSTIFGISAMAYDSTTSSLYVATASQPGVANQTTAGYGYKIEKFTLDLSNAADPKLTLVQVNNKPFIERSSLTKCVTSMVVGD